MTLKDKLYHQDGSWHYLVDGRIVDLLARDGITRDYKMSIGSCNKMINEYLDDESIIIATTKAMTEDSNIGDAFDDVTDSDL